MPQISILILTFNSEKYVDKILGSVISHCEDEFKKGDYELIILDNNSSDDTVGKVQNYKEKYTFIKFQKSNANLGYAKGVNQLSKIAKGKILLVINPDAELLEESFDELINEFNQNPKLAIAGLKIVGNDGEAEKTAGKFYNLFTFTLFSIGLERFLSFRFSSNNKQRVDFVSGGFVAFDSNKFKDLKGYDEAYFMYIEDMDICMRAKKMGFEIMFLPYGKIKHQGQGSSNKTFAIVNIFKGHQIFFRKHHGNTSYLLVKYLLRLKAILIILIGLLTGRKQLVDTYKEAIKTT